LIFNEQVKESGKTFGSARDVPATLLALADEVIE
jgi:hypothetical protein